MKNMDKVQRKYLEARRIKMEKIEEQILKDLQSNKMLERHVEIPDYFKDWIDGGRLVAVIPALDLDDEKCQSYYSVGSLKNPEGAAQNIRVSPVYMYVNTGFTDYSLPQEANSGVRNFTFDTEDGKLYSYEKMKHTQEYHYVKKPTFEEMKAHLEAHPVVLFFYGCDDGHVGKRFKTKEDAFEYLECMNVFEDIFEDSDIQHHN